MNWLQSYNEVPAGKRRPYNTEELLLICRFFSGPQSLTEKRVKCEKILSIDKDSFYIVSLQNDDVAFLITKKATVIAFKVPILYKKNSN